MQSRDNLISALISDGLFNIERKCLSNLCVVQVWQQVVFLHRILCDKSTVCFLLAARLVCVASEVLRDQALWDIIIFVFLGLTARANV